MDVKRGYQALRRKRVTIPGAVYFVTICIESRARGLTDPRVCSEIRKEIAVLETEHLLKLHAAVIMPDHLHVLFTATGVLSIGQLIGRLKFKTKSSLSSQGLSWQGNFYEHRLRPRDSIEEVVRYIYLNPYRAGLVAQNLAYPSFWMGVEESKWFQPTLDVDRPFAEWLK
jgi:putative transposase